MDLYARRRLRGEQALHPEFAAFPGALAGWEAANDETRLLYLNYVGSPWTTGMRRVLARDTALWAANGALGANVQHGDSKGGWLLGAVGELLIDLITWK